MKKYFNTIYIVFFFPYLFIFLFFNNLNSKLNYDSQDNEKPIKIDIIIHGSFLSPIKCFFYNPQKKFWSKKALRCQHINYQKRLGIEITNSGMQELESSDINEDDNARIMKYIKMNNLIYKDTYSSIKYFIFNWSGVISEKDRRTGSFLLYKGIRELQSLYPKCVISIIAYSHGGNVALGISEWANYFLDDAFQIDYLFLMGTPIGRRTKKLAMMKNKLNQYIFPTITNIYHLKDYIQILDFSFDFFLNRKLNVCREGIYNIESTVFCSKESPRPLKWYNWFEKLKLAWHSYHMHFLEDDFFSHDFIEIRKNIEVDS